VSKTLKLNYTFESMFIINFYEESVEHSLVAWTARLGEDLNSSLLAKSLSLRGLASNDLVIIHISSQSNANAACNAFGRVCLSVCLSVCALTFESLHPETSVLICRYSIRISRSRSHIKVIGSRSRSQQQKRDISASLKKHTFVGSQSLIDR